MKSHIEPIASLDNERIEKWEVEIARRIAEVETGQVKPIPWEEVREKGRKLLHA